MTEILTEYWWIGVAIIILYVYKRRRDKKRGGGGGKGSSVVPVLPPQPVGYMSCRVHDGKVYGGTYALHGQNFVVRGSAKFAVPVRESVYDMVPDGGRLLLCCEHAGGRLFRLAGNVAPIWSGGKNTIISALKIKGQLCCVSTDFDNGGIEFHNTVTGLRKTLASGKWHARQLIDGPGGWYILAFDYGSETGGWFFSPNGSDWSWRGHMPKVRPLRARKYKNGLLIAGSPFSGGSRQPPATLLHWTGKALRTLYRASDGHAMFFGLDTDGSDWYAGTLTNWNGSGNAHLYKNGKLIWRAPEPEITYIDTEDGVAHVATRNSRGTGRVYRITGEPSVTKPTGGEKDATRIGGGFVWKPVSEGDGNLVILLPASWPTPASVTVNGVPGRLATSPEHPDGRTNGNRPTFRFPRPGGAYGKNAKMVVDGQRYNVPNGAVRIG